ncbi:MAG: EamA family transporter [Paenibacillaceae bacterium]|jgi:transporter family protein|nr:EamA family transporter [Paenibacillaceae bacterium]
MSVWLIYALLSALMAALVALFGKIGLANVDANTATALRAVIMAAFLVAVVLFEGKLSQLPAIFANKKAIAFIAFSGVAGALSWLFYFIALKHGSVSQVGPVDKLSVVIAVVLAFMFLGEKLSLLNTLGVVLIAAGAIMVAVK